MRWVRFLCLVLVASLLCVPAVTAAENCGNGVDDDGDGLIDCFDAADCCSSPSCDGAPCYSGCLAGTCNKDTGACENLVGNAPLETPCDDSDTCTETDLCDGAGNCVGSFETCCDDQQDNDLDEATDCDDEDCLGIDGCPVCGDQVCDEPDPCDCESDCANELELVETSCGDGKDNDCDDAVDCEDSNCWGTAACCGNGVCDAAEEEGVCDVCPEDCADANESGQCGDEIDNDCDEATDCEDQDCWDDPQVDCCGDDICRGAEDSCSCEADCGAPAQSELAGATCFDGIDNDCNGPLDCADSACSGDFQCIIAEDCNNGIDDDGDDDIDCEDSDCDGFGCDDGASCTRNDVCSNGVCSGTPNDGLCSDGTFCNGTERCEPGPNADADGCVDGAVPCTDAGASCSEQEGRCIELDCTDRRDNDGDGLVGCLDDDCPCPDGSTCNRQTGVCREIDCDNGTDDDGDGFIDCLDQDCDGLACSDGYSCTIDDRSFCSGGACPIGRANHTLCDDGSFCNGGSVCAPGVSGADPESGCFQQDGPCPDPGAVCVEETRSCREILCRDGVDNDGDGSRDCLDLQDCPCGDGSTCGIKSALCREDLCRDGVDNDGDGAVDCADGDCPPAEPERCTDGLDNDCDGLIDCDDTADCGTDNDGDGHLAPPCGRDCNDDDPSVNPGRAEDCSAPGDEDCDQRSGCADSDCLADEDQDGFIRVPCGTDCDDGNDEVNPATAEVCGNGIDDDCDGRTDCADTDCAGVACDDGVACTVDDQCRLGGCFGIPDPDRCDDGIACTVETCDATEGCSSAPDDDLCDDGVFCDGVETCEPLSGLADVRGCVDGRDPCTEEETCDEANQACFCAEDEFEPDDPCLLARNIGPDAQLRSEEHSLCPEGDFDGFTFPARRGTEYNFFTTGNVDTLMILSDASCDVELARNNDCTPEEDNACLSWIAPSDMQVTLTVKAGTGLAATLASGETGIDEGGSGLAEPGGAERADPVRLDEGAGAFGTGPNTGTYTFWYTTTQGVCMPDRFEPEDSACHLATDITPQTGPTTEDHTLCPARDRDRWRFFGEAGVTYLFRTAGTRDTAARLLTDSCSTVLLSRDGCDGDINACFSFTPTVSDFYVVEVRGQTDAVTGPYQLVYQREGTTCTADTAELDDACAQAFPIVVDPSARSVDRSLCPGGDRDTFRFFAESGLVYAFSTSGGVDTRISIVSDGCQSTFAEELTCGTDAVNACVLWEAPFTGFFKARVTGRTTEILGDYTFHYRQDDCPRDGWEFDNQCSNATRIVPGTSLQRQAHTVCPAGEVDLWEFFAQGGTTYRFYSEGPADMGGAVIDANCSMFFEKDESSGGGDHFDLRWTAPETGFYKFGATGDSGPYDFFFELVGGSGLECQQDPFEADEVCADGTTIVPSVATQTLPRTLCGPGDRDHFTFQATQGVVYEFRTTGDTDTTGNIRSANCSSKLAGNDDCDLPFDLNTCLTWEAPSNGTFHLRIRGFSPVETVGPYTLEYRIVP